MFCCMAKNMGCGSANSTLVWDGWYVAFVNLILDWTYFCIQELLSSLFTSLHWYPMEQKPSLLITSGPFYSLSYLWWQTSSALVRSIMLLITDTVDLVLLGLLAYRIYRISRDVSSSQQNVMERRVLPILYIVIDATVLYTVLLITAIVNINSHSNDTILVIQVVSFSLCLSTLNISCSLSRSFHASQSHSTWWSCALRSPRQPTAQMPLLQHGTPIYHHNLITIHRMSVHSNSRQWVCALQAVILQRTRRG